MVLILPCTNVDGYQNDTMLNARGENLGPAAEPAEWNSTFTETKSVANLMEKYKPDMVLDVHGGHGDQTISPEDMRGVATSGTPRDAFIHAKISDMVCEKVQKEGFTSGSNVVDQGYTISRWAYKHFHSLSFGMHCKSEKTTALRIRNLLEIGNSKWPGELYPGYPNRIIRDIGGSSTLVAYGDTPGKRRASRVELWRLRDRIVTLSRWPEIMGSLMVLVSKRENYIQTDVCKYGAAFRFRLPKGSKITEVSLDGNNAEVSEEHGYVTWEDSLSTCLQINNNRVLPPDSYRARGLGDTWTSSFVQIKYR